MFRFDACKSLIFFFLVFGFVAVPVVAMSKTTVWFAPHTPQLQLPAPDFMNLFAADAPWERAASRIDVFKVYGQFVAMGSDADLRTMIAGLQQRHMALALEAGLVDYTGADLCNGDNPECGRLESQGGEHLAQLLERLKNLGGDVRYIMMDEPLWYGHILTTSQDPAAPQASIAALAKNVARQIAVAHKYFPDVQIGDAEPVGASVAPADYSAALAQWANAYKEAAGRPLSFFVADISWGDKSGWRGQLEELSRSMRSQGVPFGIIYNGNASASTGSDWTTDAERHFSDIEDNPAMVPDFAVFQSWDPQPAFALPETQPGTMTYIVNRYAAVETALDVAKTADGFGGTLASYGAPIAGAKIDAYEIDDGTLNIPTVASLTNKVPVDSVMAVVGLRVNAECNCNGAADIWLGQGRYINQTSEAAHKVDLTHSQRLIIPADRHVIENVENFPVVPGDAFSFSVPMQVPHNSENTGYVALIFLNAAGKETGRFMLPFRSGQRRIWTGVTDKKGRFVAAVNPSAPAAAVLFDFPGNKDFRLSSKFAK